MAKESNRDNRPDDASKWSYLFVDTGSYQATIVKIMYRQYIEAKSKSSWPFHWMMPDQHLRRGNLVIWSNRKTHSNKSWASLLSFFAPDKAGKGGPLQPK
jgi:hypothetical protein